jgi:catechol 2,3-dioxygenase-like lactoylglutathione lyase family enzyme
MILGAVALNTVLGIWALLSSDFGRTEGKVLATSFCVTGACVLVLANAPAHERRLVPPAPLAAMVLGVIGFVIVVADIWADFGEETAAKLAASALILAVAGTLVGLLALARLRPSHRALQPVAFVLAGAVAGTLVVLMWAEADSSFAWRVFGVEAVLLAALTVTIPVLARLLPPDEIQPVTRPASFILNVTFDAVDPRALARFWREVTGYEIVEERDDFVRLRAPDARGVRHLLFFRVDEPTPGKNRMHVDLASRQPAFEIPRLVGFGATLVDGGSPDRLSWRDGNGTRWVVLRDPEGNEFCLG